MKKAAFYVRVSTGRQEKEATAESQIDEIEKRIIADGNMLLPQCKYVDDGWSGEILARPACDLMRDAAKRKDFDVLYVYDRGRIARIFAYQEIVIEEIEDAGVEFVTLHDLQATTPEEHVMQSMQGVFHQYERVKIAERMRRGKLYKTRSGELLGYNAPYGYTYIPKCSTGNGYFVINEEEAEVVRKIYGWIGNDGYSIRKVIMRLYEEGIPPQKGKKEYWVKSVIDRLVRNRTYIGEHHYNKTEAVVPKKTLGDTKYHRVKRCSRKPKPKEDWIAYTCPAILDIELFDKVQTQLEQNSKFASRNKKHDYLLNGIIKCNCGHTRVGQPSGTQFYYRCSEGIYNYPLKPVCKEKGINADVLDTLVWEQISKLLKDKGLLKKQAKRWLNSKNKAVNNDHEIEQIKAGLSSLESESDKYLRAFGQGMVNEDTFEHRMKDVNKRKESLLAKIEEMEFAKNRKKDIPDLTVEELADRAVQSICELNFGDKLYIVRKLVNQVVGNRESVLVTGYIPITSKEKNVTYKPISRDCRPTKRRQINFIQRYYQQSSRGPKLSFLYYRSECWRCCRTR